MQVGMPVLVGRRLNSLVQCLHHTAITLGASRSGFIDPAQVFAAAMEEARGRRLHWRTLERLTRMHEEELRESSMARSELLCFQMLAVSKSSYAIRSARAGAAGQLCSLQ